MPQAPEEINHNTELIWASPLNGKPKLWKLDLTGNVATSLFTATSANFVIPSFFLFPGQDYTISLQETTPTGLIGNCI
jgi:hypothetical protein